MSEVTLEAVKARQDEIIEMIQQLEVQASAQRPVTLAFAAVDVTLQPGERYAGQVLNEDGTLKHHLVVLAATPDERLTWADAGAWAASVGGDLPTRQEAALMFANCKPHLEAGWHWTSEVYESDASYAWYCGFYYGGQGNDRKSYEGLARAVRLIPFAA